MAEKVPSSSELLEDFLRCMVCFEPFTSPKVLQCQHTFCEECLRKWNSKGGGSKDGLSCPTCRVKTPLMDDSISHLPSDFKVTRLGELLKQVLVKESTDNRPCDICTATGQHKTASHFCAQCSESFCQSCNERHRANSLFNNHHVVDLSVEESTSKLFCTQHGSKPIRYICQDCNVFICTVCAINLHNDHKVEDLETGLNKYKDNLAQLKDKIENTLDQVRTRHEQLLELQVFLKGHKEDMEEKIEIHIKNYTHRVEETHRDLRQTITTKTFSENLHVVSWASDGMKSSAAEAVDSQLSVVTQEMKVARDQLVEELRTKCLYLSQDINGRIDNVAFHVASIASLASFMEKLLTTSNALEVITVYDELTARVNSILDSEMTAFVPLSFTLIKYDSSQGERKLGLIVEEEAMIDDYLSRVQNTEEADSDNDDLDEAEVLGEMMDLATAQGDQEQSNQTNATAVTTAAASEDADVPNSPASTSSRASSARSAPDLSAIEKSTKKEQPKDKRLSLPPSHDVFISVQKHPNIEGRIPEEGSVDAPSSTPTSPTNEPWIKVPLHSRALSVDEVGLNGNVVDNDDHMRASTTPNLALDACIPEPKSLQPVDFASATPNLVWEKEGTSKTASVKKSALNPAKRNRAASSSSPSSAAGQPEVRYPTDVAFLSSGEIIVSDSGERTLQVLTADTVMWSKVKDRRQPLVRSRSVAWSQVEPVCVVPAPPLIGEVANIQSCSNSDLVVITDIKDKCVKLIDVASKGACVATWGKSWFMPMFKQPSGLAVTNEGRWIVTDVGKHAVTVHTPDGHIVHQFGSRGKGAYGFEHPKHVAVDHQGRILVSDSGNGGIKVYDNNGIFLFKIGSKESPSVTCPMGLCIDHSGNILVTDRNRHCVNMFSNDGRFIKQLLNSKQNIRYPSGIAVGPGGQLAVTQLDPPSVKFFEFSL